LREDRNWIILALILFNPLLEMPHYVIRTVRLRVKANTEFSKKLKVNVKKNPESQYCILYT
jgi:hypothetical protein